MLSTNTTLTEIGIGIVPSTAVNIVCNLIKSNRCVKSLSVHFRGEYNDVVFDVINDSLGHNSVLQDITLQCTGYHSHSYVHCYIIGAVRRLFPHVIRSVQTSQCSLKSVTFTAFSGDVTDRYITEINDIIASQQTPTDRPQYII